MMSMMLMMVVVAGLFLAPVKEVHSFAPLVVVSFSYGSKTTARDPLHTYSRLHMSERNSNNSSRDQEIAALEKQLRRLKEDDAASAQTSTETIGDGAVVAEEVSSSSSYLGRLTPDVATPMNEMLSESWKEQADVVVSDKNDVDGDDNDNSIGSALKKVAAAILFIVGLTLASQVPVGQEDFSKYSYKEPPTTATIDLGDLNPIKSVKDTVISTQE